jgi:hypothetical protein
MRNRIAIALTSMTLGAACGGPRGTRGERAVATTAHTAANPTAGQRDSEFGPLEVGADYLSYRRVTDAPYRSLAHGNRWVEVYVNATGAEAYLDGSPMPVGSIIVKTSVQDAAGKPSTTPGPIFVMEKRTPDYAIEHGNWYFAIRWASPTPDQLRQLGGPIYWRGSSPHIAYCQECHDEYDRGLGGLIPSASLPR